MTRAAFVIPGDITLPTGGYAYDRRVLALLADHGVTCAHVALPGSYPAPTTDDLAETERILAALPDDTVLLIDGLAFGAMPGDVVGRIKQKIVALVHHPLCLESGLAPMRARYLKQTETMALLFAEAVVVTSKPTARILSADFDVPDAKIEVAEPGTARAPRATGTGTPVQLLSVGSIVPRKGYDVLARALCQLAIRDLDWHLTIVGAVRDPGAHESLLACLQSQFDGTDIRARVTLVGAVDDATLAKLYDAADIFVMPSHYEGYGMALTEALVRGLPIITTSGVAAADDVPRDARRIVSPGDSGPLCVELDSLVRKPEVRRRMSDAAWAAGQELPTWDDTARAIATVLKRVSA
jgi:glycosyltransferase involved in cell wall biosynthesis